jgi:RNA polymerase sigma-70 factor (ECF subfamily)
MDDTQTTDAGLLGRIAQHDLQALELFYARHARPVFSLALALLGDRARAEDLTQEVFLLVWHSAGAYQPHGSGRAWLLRLTRNRALDELRRDRRRQMTAPLPDHVWQALPAPSIAVDAAEAHALRDALAALPAAQREVVLLAFWHGLSHQELATRLQTPLGTIKTRLRRALQTLRTQFHQSVLSTSAGAPSHADGHPGRGLLKARGPRAPGGSRGEGHGPTADVCSR